MRLRSPNIPTPKWLENCLGVLVVAAFSPVLAGVAALVGMAWVKRKLIGPTEAWGRWFAWYPAKCAINADYWPDTEWRWLEIVERRSGGIMCNTEFRVAQATQERV